MKRQIVFCAAICVLAGLLALPAFGQVTPSIKVNVPFAFNMDDKTYPAGDYTFAAHRENVVLLEKTDRTAPALLLADRVISTSTEGSAQVRFQCYDSQCFLTQVWIPGTNGGFQLHRSRGETEVAAKATGRYVALMASPRR